MIPAVIWIGAVGSLLAVWVEAVVAAPIWAFAHLDTDGEGVGQRAQTGYLFIVNVLFRPSLMIVGFILGAMMVDIMTEYVMKLFPIIIANASMNSWTGLIKIAAYIASFIIILQMIVNMSFQMIRFVPDQVLGWVGGNQTNQIGSHAADEVGGAAKNAMAARGAVTGAAGKAASDQKSRGDAARQKTAGEKSDAQIAGTTNFQNSMLAAMNSGGGTGGGEFSKGSHMQGTGPKPPPPPGGGGGGGGGNDPPPGGGGDGISKSDVTDAIEDSKKKDEAKGGSE